MIGTSRMFRRPVHGLDYPRDHGAQPKPPATAEVKSSIRSFRRLHLIVPRFPCPNHTAMVLAETPAGWLVAR